MAHTEYVIDIDLPASKEEVWQAITNFKSYHEWNTVLIMSQNDGLELGKKFNVTIRSDKKDSKFKATTLSKEINKSFSAQQKIVGKWFFSATHYFIINVSNETAEQTKFVQKWELTGFISKLFKKQIFNQLDEFKKMNMELKTYLENNSRKVANKQYPQ